MTISSETRKAGPFLGTGAVSEYPFDFKVFAAADLLVVMADELGAETELVLNSDYTVTLNADQDASPGGEVTLTDPLPGNHVLVITSDMEALQPMDLTNQGAFYPNVVDDALDRLTILIQQVEEKVTRAWKIPISSDATSADQLMEDVYQAATDAVEAAERVDLGALDDAVTTSTSNAAVTVAQNTAAQIARAAAEAARDAATVNANVYVDVATGLAAVADGVQFQVVDGEKLTRYRRDAGPVAVPLLQIYLTAFFNSLFGAGFASERTGALFSWLDSDGRLLAEIKTDGTLWSKGKNITTVANVVQDGPVRSNYLHAFLDSAGRLLGGFRLDGTFENKGVNLGAAVAAFPAVQALTIPSENIVIFGDSLAEGAGSTGGQTVGVQVAALYASGGDGRSVASFGYGGQDIASILARQGSAPALITFPSNARGFPEVPASGSVDVVASVPVLAYADPAQTKSIAGSVAGIPGTLTKAGTTGQYSFSRTTAGAAVEVDAGVPFIPATDAYRDWTTVCWIGTNNIGAAGSVPTIMAGIQTYLSFQRTQQPRRVVVMPAINCLSGALDTIKTNYADLLALVKATYPNEYIDTLSILQRNHDGSANDLADVAAGLPPRSLLSSDRYHLNSTGYGVIAAEIKRIFDLKGF